MISHFRKFIVLPLALLLTFSLSGCEGIAYREAVNLYNNQKYAQAAERFSELEGYEDSAELYTRSRYWDAVVMMEEGRYSEAQTRFQEMGDYEDSVQRLQECRYQLAVADFENGDYAQAEEAFLDFSEYRQSPEYLRQLNWLKFYDYIRENGNDAGGCFVISTQQNERTVNVMVDNAAPNQITLATLWEKDMGYVFRDEMAITFAMDNFTAVFTADSSFTMDFNGKEIGSVQTAGGHFSITTCTADMPLVPDTFAMSVTDNQGNVTDSTDFADGTMFEEMQANYIACMTVFKQVFADSGLEITLADMGFENLA